MLMQMPYFMKNDEWYTVSYDEYGDAIYTAIEKAPPKAIQSIKDYMCEYQELQETIFKRGMGPTPTQNKIN